MWSAQELWAYWQRNRHQWLRHDSGFKRECRRRFMLSCTLAGEGAFDDWRKHPEGCIGLVLLLHALPRVLYPSLAMAYEQDRAARSVVCDWLDHQPLAVLPVDQQLWLGQPLSHSERLSDQRSLEIHWLALMKRPDLDSVQKAMLEAAQERRAVIEKFGRFPERNAVLKRRSSSEEESYLAGSSGILPG